MIYHANHAKIYSHSDNSDLNTFILDGEVSSSNKLSLCMGVLMKLHNEQFISLKHALGLIEIATRQYNNDYGTIRKGVLVYNPANNIIIYAKNHLILPNQSEVDRVLAKYGLKWCNINRLYI